MSLPPASRDRSLPATPLLDAVRQRHAASATTHLCQWVHRHGLGGLEALRAEVLIPQLGPDADLWLESLLELDGFSPASGPCPVIVRAPVAMAVPAAAGSPAQAVLELRVRAEAAVDAAFDALEHSFPDAGLAVSAPIEAPPVPEPLPSPWLTDVAMGPEPLPEHSSEHSDAAGEPSSDTLPAVLSDIAASAPEPDPIAGGTVGVSPLIDGAEAAMDAEEADGLDQTGGMADGDHPSAPAVAFSALWRRLDRQRVRGMRQLRGVLRDCLEETVSPMRDARSTEALLAWEPDALGAGMGEVLLSELDSEQETLRNRAGGVSQGSPLHHDVAPAASQAMPPVVFFAARPAEEVAPQPQPLLAAPSVLDRLTQARQQRQERRFEAARGRPAPAPSALSDLRAWLPDAQDLPRAS